LAAWLLKLTVDAEHVNDATVSILCSGNAQVSASVLWPWINHRQVVAGVDVNSGRKIRLAERRHFNAAVVEPNHPDELTGRHQL